MASESFHIISIAIATLCLLFFSASNFASATVPFTITSGLVAAENFHIAVSIATTTLENSKITVKGGR